MGDWLATCKKKRLEALDSIGGIRVGDFIQKHWWSVWMQVTDVWENSVLTWWHRQGERRNTEITYFDDICLLHRADDPWDLHEVRYVSDAEGGFGGKHEQPVPDRYFYAGPIRLRAWAWKYRKYAYPVNKDGTQVGTFKNPVRNAQYEALRIADFAHVIAEPYTNLNLEEARRIAPLLRNVKDKNGWTPCIEFEAMETYNKTINLKALEKW